MTNKVIAAMICLSFYGNLCAQKGAISVSAGPHISFPIDQPAYYFKWATGVGIEAMGQYNFSDRSSLVLALAWSFYNAKTARQDTSTGIKRTIPSIKVGYRYQLTSTGYFVNALIGSEKYKGHTYLDNSETSLTLGVGKRLSINDTYFIDAGVDYIMAAESRLNIKVTFGLTNER